MSSDLNSLLAKTLFVNKLVSKEQIENLWKFVTPQKNILDLLCDGGFVKPQAAEQVLSLVQKVQAAVSTEQAAVSEVSAVSVAEKDEPLETLENTAIFNIGVEEKQVDKVENMTETAILGASTDIGEIPCVDGLQRYF
ncbi:hypothetical protein AGMMS49938_08400 [Fibrobacterales bacterium]|nr:hypothetical protein AGMMS49938_08400 [Fibrobacterales bacterium]